jgi:hypothetical protein
MAAAVPKPKRWTGKLRVAAHGTTRASLAQEIRALHKMIKNEKTKERKEKSNDSRATG